MISEISQRLDFHAESYNLFAFYYLIFMSFTTPHDIPKTVFFEALNNLFFCIVVHFFVFIFFSTLYFLCFCNVAKCII